MSLSGVIIEAWSQGVLFGGVLVLIMFTIANMRRHVLLHRLILLEVSRFHLLHTGNQLIIVVQLMLALGHGTFIFFADPTYGW
jgi:hypothetical protein